MATKEDAEATVKSEILYVLTQHYGKQLDRETIEQIRRELLDSIYKGPASWAFRYSDKNNAPHG